MVHQKHLDGNIPEMIMPAKTQSVMELVFFKTYVHWKRGLTSKFICLKYYLSFKLLYGVDTNNSQLEWT